MLEVFKFRADHAETVGNDRSVPGIGRLDTGFF